MNISRASNRKPKPIIVDVWLSPREGAEIVLGHEESPRTNRALRNMQKRIQKACRIHRDPEVDTEYREWFGLTCPAPLPNGHIQFKKSDLMNWAHRLRIGGLVAVNA